MTGSNSACPIYALDRCDDLDDDDDGFVDENAPDSDGDGICDSRDVEECDGLDNDGDFEFDEGCPPPPTPTEPLPQDPPSPSPMPERSPPPSPSTTPFLGDDGSPEYGTPEGGAVAGCASLESEASEGAGAIGFLALLPLVWGVRRRWS